MQAIENYGWKVHCQLTESAGMAIYLADYRGHRVVWEASLPFVTVDHQTPDVPLEGEYAEHGAFWTPLGRRNLAGNVRINEFRGGFELAADFATGPYRYTQLWRFHEDGRMAPWLVIDGRGVHANHTYHPQWRFDFDIDGAGNNALERFSGGRWSRIESEGWFPYTGESDKDGTTWRQLDFGTGVQLAIRPHNWEDAELFALRHEVGEWPPPSPHSDGTTQAAPSAYLNDADLDNVDIALWYIAHVHYDSAFPFTAGPWIRVDGV